MGEKPRERVLKFYGRRKGKALRTTKAEAHAALMPALTIALDGDAPVSPSRLFPAARARIILEIGFGDGEHLLQQAEANPDQGFIGCEPFINGVAALCAGVQKSNLANIRVFPDDARLLLAVLEPESLDGCYLLNSDPWPKTRHHKRRFIQKDTLDTLHRVLKPGATLWMSTDHPGLAAWELEKTLAHGGFAWTAREAADWRTRPAHMQETRYQRKNMAGHPMTFLNFKRL